MAQLKITAVQAATLRGLRSLAAHDSARKQAKKDIFNAFRTTFSIPSGIKLKVEIDDATAADYLVLKDKTSGRDLVGEVRTQGIGQSPKLVFSHVAPAPAPVTPPAAPQATARFSTAGATPTETGINRISVANLLDALRNGGDAWDDIEDDVTLPDGAPALTGANVLLDNQDGYVYFKA